MRKIIVLLFCLLVCLQASAKQLKFAQVSDIYYSPEKPHLVQLIDWTVRSLNIKNPQFVVFLGNNIGKSKEKIAIDFLNKIKPLKMPYYITFGNTDAHEMSGLKKEEFWSLVKKYNKNNKSKHGYYTFSPNNNILCIVLDGAAPYMQSSHGIYSKEQLKWFDKTLSKNKNKKIMIFQHHPLIDPVENPSLSMLNKEEYQKIIDKHNNIILISSGHFEKAKITVDEKGIYHISTPSISKPNFSYDIITLDYSKKPFGKIKINEINVTTIDLQ